MDARPPLKGVVTSMEELDCHRRHAAYFLLFSTILQATLDERMRERRELEPVGAMSMWESDIAGMVESWTVMEPEDEDLTSEKSWADARALHHLGSIASAECRILFDNLRAALPRELRDIVYEHLDPTDRVVLRSHSDLAGLVTTFDPLLHLATSDYTPRFWDIEYTGMDGRRELVENWYRRSLFDFNMSFSVALKFASLNAQEVGIVPRDVITKVQFAIDTTELYTRISNGLHDHHRFLARFDAFFAFREGTKILIIIRLGHRPYDLRRKKDDYIRTFGDARKVLDVLWPVLTRAREAKLNLRVCFKPFRFEAAGVKFSPSAWIAKLQQCEYNYLVDSDSSDFEDD